MSKCVGRKLGERHRDRVTMLSNPLPSGPSESSYLCNMSSCLVKCLCCATLESSLVNRLSVSRPPKFPSFSTNNHARESKPQHARDNYKTLWILGSCVAVSAASISALRLVLGVGSLSLNWHCTWCPESGLPGVHTPCQDSSLCFSSL